MRFDSHLISSTPARSSQLWGLKQWLCHSIADNVSAGLTQCSLQRSPVKLTDCKLSLKMPHSTRLSSSQLNSFVASTGLVGSFTLCHALLTHAPLQRRRGNVAYGQRVQRGVCATTVLRQRRRKTGGGGAASRTGCQVVSWLLNAMPMVALREKW